VGPNRSTVPRPGGAAPQSEINAPGTRDKRYSESRAFRVQAITGPERGALFSKSLNTFSNYRLIDRQINSLIMKLLISRRGCASLQYEIGNDAPWAPLHIFIINDCLSLATCRPNLMPIQVR
jgi:hypothetical protein